MAIQISIQKDAPRATVGVGGFLNAGTACELEAKVDEVMRDCPTVTFDLSALEYISSAGLRVLMMAYKRAVAAGGAVSVVGMSDEVREVFDITGFSDLFGIE
jgi:anti-sigma B factor antagonist